MVRKHMLVVVSVVVAACSPPTVRDDPFSAVDSVVARALANGPIAGAAVGIVRDGELLFEGAYGVADLESRRRVTPETQFNLASVGKVLTAAIILRLAESGTLELGARLTDMVPELRDADAAGSVTLRHVLTMTSGLPDYAGADVARWLRTRQPLEPEFVFDFVRDTSRVFEPGDGWLYSNTGFYLAALAAEGSARRPWSALAGDFLRSVGIEDIGLCDSAGSSRAMGYELEDGALVRSAMDQETGLRGDGGFCGTAGALAMLPTRLPGGGLSRETLAEMTASTRLSSTVEVDYGIGVAKGTLFGRRLWGHLGGFGSYIAVLAHFPDDETTISVLINTRFADVGALVLLADVAAVVFGVGAEPLLDPPVPDSLREALAGLYVGDRERVGWEIVGSGPRVVRHRPGGDAPPLPLLWQGGLTFGREDWPLDRFRFHRAGGDIVAFSVYYNGFFDGYYARVRSHQDAIRQ